MKPLPRPPALVITWGSLCSVTAQLILQTVQMIEILGYNLILHCVFKIENVKKLFTSLNRYP